MKKTLMALTLLSVSGTAAASCPAYLNHDMRKLHSDESVNLCETHNSKPMLIVNTASHCGFTKQFTGLEELHQKYRDRVFVVGGLASHSSRK
jgi:glutathione peroxidase